ncbi:MAG: FAD-dependent oxidoreductase [Planctomycetales bacterium]|nr:FAD-dependent oxidoreductase [Planctomycetales bacterium]
MLFPFTQETETVSDRYDLVVIGAGIQGAGVAQAAAAAGYRTLVLEQTAIAAATSSQSSKLIHGGLRYLESAQFRLVREALRERALLIKLAPELVKLVPFYLPIFKQSRRKAWQLRVGLNLYRALGGFGPGTGFTTLDKSEWAGLDGLVTDDLVSVFRYYDGQTDDAVLTRAVMRSAESLGAELKMPAEFVGAKIAGDHCQVAYREGAAEHSCRCAVLVNCGGPWAARLLETIEPRQAPFDVELVQGSHLWLELEAPSGCYYLEAPSDGRGVFAIPWYGETLVGTTETVHHGPPEEARTLPAETEYLLKTLGHYFPRYRDVAPEQIKREYCGLRVLPKSGGSPFSRSREVIIHGDRTRAPRMVSVMGGKLTTYRLTAQKVMKMVEASLPAAETKGDTARLPLRGE